MRYLTVKDVEEIRPLLAALDTQNFGPEHATRPELLDSAVERQHIGFGNARKYTTPTEIAAAVFYGIIKNHAFDNGNKRTALAAMWIALEANAIALPEDVCDDELYDIILAVAASQDETIMEKWLTKRTRQVHVHGRTVEQYVRGLQTRYGGVLRQLAAT